MKKKPKKLLVLNLKYHIKENIFTIGKAINTSRIAVGRGFVSFFLNFGFIYLFIYFLYGCAGSSPLCKGFLQLRQVEATLHCGARASHYRGLSHCGAQAPDAQAQ